MATTIVPITATKFPPVAASPAIAAAIVSILAPAIIIVTIVVAIDAVVTPAAAIATNPAVATKPMIIPHCRGFGAEQVSPKAKITGKTPNSYKNIVMLFRVCEKLVEIPC